MCLLKKNSIEFNSFFLYLNEVLNNKNLFDKQLLQLYFQLKKKFISNLKLRDFLYLTSYLQNYFLNENFNNNAEELFNFFPFLISLSSMNMYQFLTKVFSYYNNLTTGNIDLESRENYNAVVIYKNQQTMLTEFEMADFNLFCDIILSSITKRNFNLRVMGKGHTRCSSSYTLTEKAFNFQMYEFILHFKGDKVTWRPKNQEMADCFPGTFDTNLLTNKDFGFKENLNTPALEYLHKYDPSFVNFIIYMVFTPREIGINAYFEKYSSINAFKNKINNYNIDDTKFYFFKANNILNIVNFFQDVEYVSTYNNYIIRKLKKVSICDLEPKLISNYNKKLLIFFEAFKSLDSRYSETQGETYINLLQRDRAFTVSEHENIVYDLDMDGIVIKNSKNLDGVDEEEIQKKHTKGYDLKTYLEESGKVIFFDHYNSTVPTLFEVKKKQNRKFLTEKAYISNIYLTQNRLDIKSSNFKTILSKISKGNLLCD
jgi:hypothetical protein